MYFFFKKIQLNDFVLFGNYSNNVHNCTEIITRCVPLFSSLLSTLPLFFSSNAKKLILSSVSWSENEKWKKAWNITFLLLKKEVHYLFRIIWQAFFLSSFTLYFRWKKTNWKNKKNLVCVNEVGRRRKKRHKNHVVEP